VELAIKGRSTLSLGSNLIPKVLVQRLYSLFLNWSLFAFLCSNNASTQKIKPKSFSILSVIRQKHVTSLRCPSLRHRAKVTQLLRRCEAVANRLQRSRCKIWLAWDSNFKPDDWMVGPLGNVASPFRPTTLQSGSCTTIMRRRDYLSGKDHIRRSPKGGGRHRLGGPDKGYVEEELFCIQRIATLNKHLIVVMVWLHWTINQSASLNDRRLRSLLEKKRPQSGGRGFIQFGQGGGVLKCGRPHLLGAKNSDFLKFTLCPHGQGGRGHFVRTSFMDGPKSQSIFPCLGSISRSPQHGLVSANARKYRRMFNCSVPV